MLSNTKPNIGARASHITMSSSKNINNGKISMDDNNIKSVEVRSNKA